MSDKDLQYYDGTDWQSLSEIAAAKLQATLPISDRLVDPTVTVDGADGVFTATAGAGKYQLLNSGFPSRPNSTLLVLSLASRVMDGFLLVQLRLMKAMSQQSETQEVMKLVSFDM